MKFYERENTVIIEGADDFNLTHTFTCGQCFRWNEEDDGSYTGVVFSKAVNILQNNGIIELKNVTAKEFEEKWIHYFDLDCDYNLIKSSFKNDKNVTDAIKFGWGIKILNQEIFVCLISFIISTQNAIYRIKRIVASLSEMYGEKTELDGKVFYTFPTIEALENVTITDLAPLKAGYRAEYIIDAVRKIKTGEVNLNKILYLPYREAKDELMKIKGVGPKVADCVLLFSAGKKEAFPIDVWVKRTVRLLYLDENANEKKIEGFAKEHFGKYAGVAQQYLFYYARENKLGI